MKYDFFEISRSLNESIFNNEVEIKKIYAPACMVHALIPKEIGGEAKLVTPSYAVDKDKDVIFINPDLLGRDREDIVKVITSAMAHLHCLQNGKYSNLL